MPIFFLTFFLDFLLFSSVSSELWSRLDMTTGCVVWCSIPQASSWFLWLMTRVCVCGIWKQDGASRPMRRTRTLWPPSHSTSALRWWPQVLWTRWSKFGSAADHCPLFQKLVLWFFILFIFGLSRLAYLGFSPFHFHPAFETFFFFLCEKERKQFYLVHWDFFLSLFERDNKICSKLLVKALS